VLDRLSLFYNATLKQETDDFYVMMCMFEMMPNRAAQVDELFIKPHYGIKQLFTTFPNARTIRVEPNTLIKKSQEPNPFNSTFPLIRPDQKSKISQTLVTAI
jgi:hypothetical protein